MAWLEVDALTKNYPDFRLGLDFSCEEGEIVAILGPSGAGKSTLLRLLAGLIIPDAGELRIAGRNVAGLSPRERGVGLVFQDFALFPHYSVARNIAYGMKVRHVPAAEQARRVAELLRRFSLPDFGARRIASLSGGEKQRVALARALAVEPRLMLFDEPLGSLDAALRRELRAELRLLQRELGYTSISVTHDQEDALAVSDRLLVMKDGRIVQSGSPEDIYQRPATSFVASFFGDANILKVTGSPMPAPGGSGARLFPTNLGLFTVANDQAGQGGMGGSALFIRSEKLVIETAYPAPGSCTAGNRLTLVVSDLEFLGRGYLVRGSLPEVPGASLRFWTAQRPRIGELVGLHLPPEDLLLIPDA